MYGSLEGISSRTSPDKFQWEKRGTWFHMLLAAGVPVVEEMGSLSIIAFTVFYTRKLFMSCDARKIGVPAAFVCECTKSSLRYFPLLAIVISIIIAKRMLLRHRIYYQMLRHGYLLDFQTVWPVTDHLFICLAVCMFLGSLHLVLIFFYSPTFSDFYPYAKDTALAYFAPSATFFVFLARAYDTDNQLLPLNKYLVEQPEVARARLVTMPVIRDVTASAVVRQGLHIPEGKETCTSAESFAELVAVASDGESASSVGSPAGSPMAASLSMAVARRFVQEGTRLVRFVEEMWPAGLLLDRRLQDEASRSFRSVWYVGVALFIPLTAAVLYHLGKQTKKDVQDVYEGQYEDVGALIVEALYASVIVWLLSKLYHLMARLFLRVPSTTDK